MNMFRLFTMGSILLMIILFEVYPLCLANPIESSETPESAANSLKQNSKEESLNKLPDLSFNDNSTMEKTTKNYFSWATLDPLSLLGGWMKTMYKQPSRIVRKIPRKFSKKIPVRVSEKPDTTSNILLNDENLLSEKFGRSNQRKLTVEKSIGHLKNTKKGSSPNDLYSF